MKSRPKSAGKKVSRCAPLSRTASVCVAFVFITSSVIKVVYRSGFCRADTSARLRAKDAREAPQAAAQIKSEGWLDGYPAKNERDNDGKTPLSHS